MKRLLFLVLSVATLASPAWGGGLLIGSGVSQLITDFNFNVVSSIGLSGKFSTVTGQTITVNWGDGNSNTYSGTDQTYSHTYSVSGNYSVNIVGGGSKLTKFTMEQSGTNIYFNLSSLPSGLTYFTCTGSNTITGNLSLPSGMTYFYCAGSNTITGNLSPLPSGLTYFNCAGSNTITGNLSSLPSGLTTFICTGSNTITGNLSSLPSGLTTFTCTGSNTITGNLSLPSGLTTFTCAGSNTITGNLSSLPSGMTTFICTGSNTISDYSGKTWASNQKAVDVRPVGAGGLSSAEIDQLLIDLDAAGGTWVSPKTIILTGTNQPRTSFSDSAVASLQSKGVTVTTTP